MQCCVVLYILCIITEDQWQCRGLSYGKSLLETEHARTSNP